MNILYFFLIFLSLGVRLITDYVFLLMPSKVDFGYLGLTIYMFGTSILTIGLLVSAFIMYGFSVFPYFLAYLLLCFVIASHRT